MLNKEFGNCNEKNKINNDNQKQMYEFKKKKLLNHIWSNIIFFFTIIYLLYRNINYFFKKRIPLKTKAGY